MKEINTAIKEYNIYGDKQSKDIPISKIKNNINAFLLTSQTLHQDAMSILSHIHQIKEQRYIESEKMKSEALKVKKENGSKN
jgi:hypothetical protein